jgi:hypothetical protein
MTPKPARSASPRLHPPKGNEGEGKEGPRTKSHSSPLLPFPPELPTGPGSPPRCGIG